MKILLSLVLFCLVDLSRGYSTDSESFISADLDNFISRPEPFNKTCSYGFGKIDDKNMTIRNHVMCIKAILPGKENFQSCVIKQQSRDSDTVEENVVIPNIDGRRRVKETTKWPFSIHAKIISSFGKGKDDSRGGTGTMVGLHHVLTCGHNVYFENKWPEWIHVSPGLDETYEPFGMVRVAQVYVHRKWYETADNDYDIALMILEESIGSRTGCAGVCYLDKQNILKQFVEITGYPNDKGGYQMYSMGRTPTRFLNNRILHEVDTDRGQSGSALWVYGEDKIDPFVVGVQTLGFKDHCVGDKRVNQGVYINKEIFNSLKSLIEKTYILNKSRINNSKPLAHLLKNNSTTPKPKVTAELNKIPVPTVDLKKNTRNHKKEVSAKLELENWLRSWKTSKIGNSYINFKDENGIAHHLTIVKDRFTNKFKFSLDGDFNNNFSFNSELKAQSFTLSHCKPKAF